MGGALGDGCLVEELEDDARAGFARLEHHRTGVGDAPAQGQVRIAGVGKPAIVVQVDVRQLGVRLAENVVTGAADGGEVHVEDEADPRRVLDDDAHAELALARRLLHSG